MRYNKLILSITATMLFGSFASAQTERIELSPNSIIAYFAEDGALLPDRSGSEYYRYFKDIVSGCYLIQDFYSSNDQKQTDPVCFTDPSELQSWVPMSMQGPLIFWDKNGHKLQAGYSNQDGGRSGFWQTWDAEGNTDQYELINGELILSYYDVDGNPSSHPSEGGTFRTLIDYDQANDEFLVADYFTDSRTKQMDPVVVQREDLIRWNIQYRDGVYSYYNEEGDLLTVEEFDAGRLEGTVTNWYAGSYPAQKFEEINFSNNQQDGLTIRWYQNGYPQFKIMVENDSIVSMECWDDRFTALDSEQCFALLNDNIADAEQSYKNDEATSDFLGDDAAVSEIESIPSEENFNEEYQEAIEAEEATPSEENFNEEYQEVLEAENIPFDDSNDEELLIEDEEEEQNIEPLTEGQQLLQSIHRIFNAL